MFLIAQWHLIHKMKEKVLLLIFLISIVILPIYGIEQIPEWVKNNAEYAENQIDDESFLNALEFLLKIYN